MRRSMRSLLLLGAVAAAHGAAFSLGVRSGGEVSSRGAGRCVRSAIHAQEFADDDDMGELQVSLRDPDDGKMMECTLLETLDMEGELFASMTPRDAPAVIATLEDGAMIEIDDVELVQKLFPTAQAVCAEQGLELVDSAVTLTIVGGLSALEDVGLFEGEEAESTMPELAEADNVEEEEEEGAEAVLSFYSDGTKYYLMRLLDPLVLVGKQVSASSFEIPTEEEMAVVAPVLEGMMEDAMDEAMDEALDSLDDDDDEEHMGI